MFGEAGVWTEEQKLRRKIESSWFNHIGDTAIAGRLTGLTSLAIFLKQEAMTACFRLKMNKQWKHIPFEHARSNREFDEIAPAGCSRSDSIIAQYVFDKNYEV